MWVEEGNRGGCDFWALELFDSGFQKRDSLAHELRPRFSLSIIVLASVCLLGTDTLLTGGLCSIAPLEANVGQGDTKKTRVVAKV